MSKFHTGPEIELINTANLDSRLETLGLKFSDFLKIVDSIPPEAFKSPESVFDDL